MRRSGNNREPQSETKINSRGNFVHRTPESAVAELRAAHEAWKSLPEDERGKFNKTWLEKQFSSLEAWIRSKGGVDSFVKLAGGDVEKDFEKREVVRGRTPESAVAELRAAHEAWKSLPEDERGKFNFTWLQNNYSFVKWMDTKGGVDSFVKLAGGDVEKDFEKREVVRGRTSESAVAELRAAHEAWKALPEGKRGKFSPVWLHRNFRGLLAWMDDRGGPKNFTVIAGGDVEKDFEKQDFNRDRTPESAVLELRAAHEAWKALPENERGKFNTTWLINNFFSLEKWSRRHGGLNYFLELAGSEVENDFEKLGVSDRTPESAVLELRAAHEAWKALPENERGKFNHNWLKNNYYDLLRWIKNKDGLDHFVKFAGGEVEKDFEKQDYNRDRTPESAVLELRAAHEAWKALPENERGKFNHTWLTDNYSFVKWMDTKGGLDSFVKFAGGEVEKDFEKQDYNRDRTPESAVLELRAAHEAWKALPENERGKLNKTWLVKNHPKLYGWILRHGGIDSFIKQLGGEVEKDFEKRDVVRGRTSESAVAELRAAHEAWKALPENERGKFSKIWLLKNANSLYEWMYKHGGIDSFIKQLGGEVEKDFEKREMERGRTPESAVLELRAAHEAWKALPENERGKFNQAWLVKNYFKLLSWMLNHGGIDFFIKLAGSEAEKDFEIRGLDKKKELLENSKLTIREMAEGQTADAKQFRSLVAIFGASRALDILYKFRPEFKGLPVEYVKSCIADYLGDFLSAKQDFNLKDVKFAAELLSETTFQEGLYEVLKDHCLRYYYAQKKFGVHQDGFSIINAYLDHVVEEIGGISNKFLDDIVQKVLEFYDSALRDFKKPEQFVDRLSEGRDFPDINQRVNMKELAEKKKMLIADEMGLGKSASVIMAKEQLGVGCALVVAPSNVIETWVSYLSDDENKKGYFKKGSAPRVLKVESPKQLVGISKTDYDYILISQERMVPSYTEQLENLDVDMMVVDEIHKIKSTKGVRTQSFLPLAKKMEGDGKYLALLSGTPAPNKIKDIAVILKLLYPERFSNMSDTDLVRNIIHGDLIDLRSLLMPRMQMKDLKDSVEMPELTESVVSVEMSRMEKDIYEVFLEQDEATASEKLQTLRQFLLNPHSMDPTPGLESCKINALGNELNRAFANKSKVVVFVNGYIENIIRGDTAIMEKLNLPPGVEVRVIDGETKKKDRNKTQQEFNEDNGKKILLLVSGDTADVGVSFTGGEEVIFYNEPWTEASRRQQLARVYRPGQEKAVVVKTLVVKNSIEEGIHTYIQDKYKAVEKLLKGVPLTDLEKQQLAQDEKSNDDKSKEINREWAEYFFSSVEMLNKIFGRVKNIGEEMFRKFLVEYGAKYAEAYRDLGSRSYQSNSNRVTGTLISRMVAKSGQRPEDLVILDVASGPEMLRRHIVDSLQDSVHSLDINPEHFDDTSGNKHVGSWTKMPFEDKSFDYLNLAMSLHYSEFVPSKGKLERIELLKEMNRVLKESGRLVMSMIHTLDLKDMEKFAKFAEVLGFRIVEDFSGLAENDVRFRSQVVTLEKVKDVEKTKEEIFAEAGSENSAGFKFKRNEIQLRKSRKVLRGFFLNGKSMPVEHNSRDSEIMEEETQIATQGIDMKTKHKTIAGIPAQDIIETNFIRIAPKKRYLLFKRLVSGPGAVVIKDSDKNPLDV